MLRKNVFRLAVGLIVAVLGIPAAVLAWAPGGNLIDNCAPLIDSVMIGDGQGGAYIAWVDRCGSIQWATYCQRIDADGNALWPEGGVMVSGANPETPRDVREARSSGADTPSGIPSKTQR